MSNVFWQKMRQTIVAATILAIYAGYFVLFVYAVGSPECWILAPILSMFTTMLTCVVLYGVWQLAGDVADGSLLEQQEPPHDAT